jgi:quercetin dioxygenase-like cupin family protein
MKRKNFIVGTAALIPLGLFGRIKTEGGRELPEGFRVSAGEARFGEHYDMKGITRNRLDIKISSDDTGGALAVFEQTGESPNGGPPLHIHPFQDEWFYVIEGDYIFQLGQEKFSLKQGDSIFLPRNIPHAFIQLNETGKLIVAYQPAGRMEAFFKATDRWTSPPSQEEMTRLFEEHEMKITGPPMDPPLTS